MKMMTALKFSMIETIHLSRETIIIIKCALLKRKMKRENPMDQTLRTSIMKKKKTSTIEMTAITLMKKNSTNKEEDNCLKDCLMKTKTISHMTKKKSKEDKERNSEMKMRKKMKRIRIMKYSK
jgi:hypothetical protein